RTSFVDIRWVYLDEAPPPERRPHTPVSRMGPLFSDHDVHDKSGDWLRTYVPVYIAGRPLTALEFSENLSSERAVVVRHAVLRALRSVGMMAFSIGLAAAFLGVLLVARPIRRLVEHARRVGRGDLTPRGSIKGRDEIAELGREMNAMCVQLVNAQDAKL